MAEQYREEIIEAGHQLLNIHDYPNADLKYDRFKIFEYIDRADVIIIPSRWRLEPAKSVNRLAQAWGRGKACVVSPLPAYMKYVKPGINALVGTTRDEFLAQTLRLCNDPALRESLGREGRETANKYLHPRSMIDHFLTGLGNVTGPTDKDWDPAIKLQVIVPHYASTTQFIELCLESLVAADHPDMAVTVSSSCQSPDIARELKEFTESLGCKFIHSEKRLSFSEANNAAIRDAAPDRTHFLLLNDDTVVSKTAFRGYFAALAGRDDIVLNPYSNCDQGWLHRDEMVVDGVRLHPGMSLDEVDGKIDSLRAFQPSTDTTLIPASFCAAYATLIPNRVLRAVGPLSVEYLNGGEDADFSYRCQKMGFQTYWTKAAFVFHFGGKTRKVSQDEDPDRHAREDHFNNSLLASKWPQRSESKRMAIWTGPAWEKWGMDSYKTGGIGGSETCAARLAETAAANGWQVTMIGEHEPGWVGSIQMVDWKNWDIEAGYWDLFVASRSLNPVDWRLKAKRIVVWVHDIFCLSGKTIADSHFNRVDQFLALSPWHRDFLIQHHEIPEKYRHKVIVVPNGVNTELFEG